MTNSERRLTYLPKLVEPPGEALPDAVIVTRVARELGFKDAFPYESAAEIFDEYAALTAGTAVRLLGREPRAPRGRRAAPVAGAGARRTRAPRASTPTAASPPRRPRAARRRRARPARRAARRAPIRSRSRRAASATTGTR